MTAGLNFYSNGVRIKIRTKTLGALQSQAPALAEVNSRIADAAKSASNLMNVLSQQHARMAPLFQEIIPSSLRVMPTETNAIGGMASAVIPTETLIVEGALTSTITQLKNKYGLKVIAEGRNGKLLLRSEEGGDQALKQVFDASIEAYENEDGIAAHPNFIRVLAAPSGAPPSSTETNLAWHFENTGAVGIEDADVDGYLAWSITKGSPDIGIAVLDDGIDKTHSNLGERIRAEFDAVDGNSTAQPDGNDAHGTACAGIISYVDEHRLGIAPECSLISVRIAKGGDDGRWIFDDFATADAIDWAWQEAQADVISNSWSGGPPVDVISNSLQRARTKGRDGMGAVVVAAAGNNQGPVEFPGTVSGTLTVGASNQWDKRKTRGSADNEMWWGSNFGPELDVLAPGVKIPTTDIKGLSGYSKKDFYPFSGTSAATPIVAGAAALVLSTRPDLSESQVRQLLCKTAEKNNGSKEWNKLRGHGRINCLGALESALHI